MAVTSTTLKAYLRLPSDSTEDLDLFINAAKAKAKAAGIDEPDALHPNAQYELFITALAAYYYDHRDFELDPDCQKMIDSFVLELRYKGADENE